MNILIIDDHSILREGIEKKVLKVFPSSICHFEDNIKGAILKFQKLQMDLILCDLEFGNDSKDGFQIIENILKFEPRTKAVAFTNYYSYRVMNKAIKSGFLSFLDKNCSFLDFENTLSNVVEYGVEYESISMKQLRKKRNKFTRSIFSESLYGISDLSPKELELTLLTNQTTDRNVLAEKMSNSPFTIDTYFKSIVSKLHLKHREHVALFCAEFYDELLKFKKV